MGRRRLPAGLLPPGLIIEQVQIDEGGVAAIARSRDAGSTCPACGKLSRRVHSRYVQSLSDLPAHGRRVRIALTVRRFRCGNDVCPRMIFAERVRRGHRRTLRSPYGAAADHRPPSRAGARRAPRPGACPAPADAGEQGHAAADRPGPGTGAGGAAGVTGDRHRRLGVEARASLRQHRLRPGAARDRRSSSRPRGCHGRGMAGGSSRGRDRLARPRRRLWPGRRPRGAGSDPGRRSLAPDGEREPGRSSTWCGGR